MLPKVATGKSLEERFGREVRLPVRKRKRPTLTERHMQGSCGGILRGCFYCYTGEIG